MKSEGNMFMSILDYLQNCINHILLILLFFRFNENVTVTVNTVDSFQGMENDVIIVSCVRYAPNYFLQNEQRLNVALTRARQALYVFGNYSLFKVRI